MSVQCGDMQSRHSVLAFGKWHVLMQECFDYGTESHGHGEVKQLWGPIKTANVGDCANVCLDQEIMSVFHGAKQDAFVVLLEQRHVGGV